VAQQNANAPTPVSQNANALTPAPQKASTPAPAPQKAGAPTPAPQNASAPTPAPQNANVPTLRPDRLPEVHEFPARDAPAKPLHDSPGSPGREGGSSATEPSNNPSRHTAELKLVVRRARSWLSQLISSTFIRLPMIFFIGVVTTLAWQSYSDAGREAIASWCRLQVPHATSVAQSASSPEDLVAVSPDLLKATSLDLLKATSVALAAVRESIDKLAADLTKLQTAERGAPDKASAASPQASGMPPASRPPGPRAPPAR
jgi:hypothetical protein